MAEIDPDSGMPEKIIDLDLAKSWYKDMVERYGSVRAGALCGLAIGAAGILLTGMVVYANQHEPQIKTEESAGPPAWCIEGQVAKNLGWMSAVTDAVKDYKAGLNPDEITAVGDFLKDLARYRDDIPAAPHQNDWVSLTLDERGLVVIADANDCKTAFPGIPLLPPPSDSDTFTRG